MQKVYFISGLAASSNIFSKLKLQNIQPHYLEWQIPLPKETIEEYAFRISEVIEEDAIIVGVSFGGIMAHEISLVRNIKKVIIVSSIKSANEKPAHYKFFSQMRLHKVIPVTMLKKMKWLVYLTFGTKTAEEKMLLSKLVDNSNNQILSWSVNQFLKWNRNKSPENLIQVSGTNDRIFSHPKLKPDYTVVDGSHFMIYSKSDELSELLQKILNS